MEGNMNNSRERKVYYDAGWAWKIARLVSVNGDEAVLEFTPARRGDAPETRVVRRSRCRVFTGLDTRPRDCAPLEDEA
jgi:hypothetical protein